MTKLDYWEECIANAAEECELAITPNQLKYLADAVCVGVETIGMCFRVPENPLERELETAKASLKIEREKIVCPECLGTGIYVICGPYHWASMNCSKCRGEGKVSP